MTQRSVRTETLPLRSCVGATHAHPSAARFRGDSPAPGCLPAFRWTASGHRLRRPDRESSIKCRGTASTSYAGRHKSCDDVVIVLLWIAVSSPDRPRQPSETTAWDDEV